MKRLGFGRILVTGASGFIGRHVHHALAGAACQVVPVSRRHGVDMADRRAPKDWLDLLDGVEAVVNVAGIIGETKSQRFSMLHTEAPVALFRACQALGVRRVVQVSALGADAAAFSAYHRSKWAADRVLLALDLDAVVLRPALTYGPGGTSARQLLHLSRLPWLPVPADGRQALQPLDVADLTEAVLRCLAPSPLARRTVDLVGPETFTFAAWLQRLRAAQGLSPAPLLCVPGWLARAVVFVGQPLDPALRPDNLRMLMEGYRGNPREAADLLGRAPAAPDDARLLAALKPPRSPA